MNQSPQALGPAVAKGLSYLEKGLEEGWWAQGQALPRIKTLAHNARVSTVSLWKALTLLKQQGRITTERGGRIWAGTPTAEPSEALERNLKWQKLSTRIQQDILSGRFSPSLPLPSLHELQVRYGITFATLKKALDELVVQGILGQQKRQYHLQPLVKRKSFNAITLSGLLNEEGGFHIINQRMRDFIGTLERECARANIRLELLGFNPRDWIDKATELRSDPKYLGHFFWIGEMVEVVGVTQEVRAFLTELSRGKVRVSVLDEMGGFTWKQPLGHTGATQVFALSDQFAGEAVARSLLGLGHRNILYLSPSHKHAWSQQRLMGLRKGFSMAGFENAVQTETQTELGDLNELTWSLFQYSGDQWRAFWTVNNPKARADLGYDHFFQVTGREMLARITPEQRYRLRVPLRLMDDMELRKEAPDFFAQLRTLTTEFTTDKSLGFYLEPMFERALAMTTSGRPHAPTAWVCASDKVAFVAQHWLKQKGIKVPQDLSLVAFDNTPEAFTQGLSSYHFNITRFANRMLDFVLDRPGADRFRRGSIFVEGLLLERHSMGSPPRSLKKSHTP